MQKRNIFYAHKLITHGFCQILVIQNSAWIQASAPPDVTPVNTDGRTIHSGLVINCKGHIYPVNDKQTVNLQNKFYEVVIIDEISMVSRKYFTEINLRSTEILGDWNVCGDFFQSKPMKPPTIDK